MLATIRMEIARNDGYPHGSAAHGYDVCAPLTRDGHLDQHAFHQFRDDCSVRHFTPGAPDRVGSLHFTRHRDWAFFYEPGEADDERIHRLGSHIFRVGEYLTVTDPEGEALTYRVVAVT